MRLKAYLSSLHDTCLSRRDAEVEFFAIREVIPNRAARIEGRLRFWNSSLLEFIEIVEEIGLILTKSDYSYHYQEHNGQLVFRYDNAPHHPEISTYPHHKHVLRADRQLERIVSATAPQLWDVLREIDRVLYPKGR